MIDVSRADALVVLSPHASGLGVYDTVAGDLAGFGIDGVSVSADPHPARAQVGLETMDSPLDYGVVVPLALRDWGLPVIAVGVTDGAVPTLDIDVPMAVIASVNTSAGLSARAPLTEVPGAGEAEERFVAALQQDAGSVRDLDLPGTCSTAVISFFAHLFEGRATKVLAHEAPVGVGYLVAEVA